MIEVTKLAIKNVAVGAVAPKLRHQIGETTVLQGRDRIFLGVGVQVTDDQHVGVTRLRGDCGDKAQQGVSLGDALCVVTALTIQLIGVGAGGVGAALRLEVVDHHRKAAARSGCKELRNRRAVMDRVVVDDRRTDGRHYAGLVDEANLDGVGADHAGVDGGIGSRAGHNVQISHNLSQRIDIRRILQLDQAKDIRVQAIERGGELGLLLVALGGVIRPAAVKRR